ncbi:enoyl-CoA hydratase-related protein [Rhizobium sp. RU36D]|uniref:enoyl-CoA hydratase-related protein n=1 Tax=Rhizobium sp. RU36D TaxID=1907415 RepID=UPI0009D83A3E|nr:enoyl-CoA hydratase-related protein [Rhizobium sp. RU36D]SMD12779.1 enoyl-CoA hydratase [Rhizobium sp. RU36D]
MAIIVEKSDRIATITIDRPPVNAITIADYAEIADTFEVIGGWSDINCVIFTATGSKAFCAGLDLNEFLAATIDQDPARARTVRRCFAAVRHAPVPVIAAVNGPALGAGAVLASCCDVRIASENARFATPEINVGRCGGAAHMMRHIPQGLLRRMYFTGLPISAAEALQCGFVQEVVSQEELAPRARALAEIIASKAPIGLRVAKEALNKVEFMQTEDGYQLEQSYSTALMTTEDAREATRAVVEKRAPVWVGR